MGCRGGKGPHTKFFPPRGIKGRVGAPMGLKVASKGQPHQPTPARADARGSHCSLQSRRKGHPTKVAVRQRGSTLGSNGESEGAGWERDAARKRVGSCGDRATGWEREVAAGARPCRAGRSSARLARLTLPCCLLLAQGRSWAPHLLPLSPYLCSAPRDVVRGLR